LCVLRLFRNLSPRPLRPQRNHVQQLPCARPRSGPRLVGGGSSVFRNASL
jgi:hypothetical protein